MRRPHWPLWRRPRGACGPECCHTFWLSHYLVSCQLLAGRSSPGKVEVMKQQQFNPMYGSGSTSRFCLCSFCQNVQVVVVLTSGSSPLPLSPGVPLWEMWLGDWDMVLWAGGASAPSPWTLLLPFYTSGHWGIEKCELISSSLWGWEVGSGCVCVEEGSFECCVVLPLQGVGPFLLNLYNPINHEDEALILVGLPSWVRVQDFLGSSSVVALFYKEPKE